MALLREKADAPIVVFTPMLPATQARVKKALGDRVFVGMTSVLGRVTDAGVARYWLSRATRTLIEDPVKRPGHAAALHDLTNGLAASGIEAGFELGLEETSAATALAFLPLAMGLDVAGSADALMADGRLLKTTLHAFDEARALAQRVGALAGWMSLFARFLGPLRIKVGLSLARRRSPEAIAFLEEHFGRRARSQNRALGAEALALAQERGVRHEAMATLLARLA
jgi:hypothetical protein